MKQKNYRHVKLVDHVIDYGTVKVILPYITFLLHSIISPCTFAHKVFMMSTQTDEQAIRDMHEEIIEAFNSYNLEKLLSMHTEDIIVMESGRPAISTKEEIRQIFKKAFDHVRSQNILFNLSFKIHEIEIWGDRAFARGQVNKITRNENGGLQEDHGKYLCLFKKQVDGTWLRSHVIANDDAPGKTAAEEFLKE